MPPNKKICKDGRIWGQNNKEAGNHLGVLAEKKSNHIFRRRHGPGEFVVNNLVKCGVSTRFKKGHKINVGVKKTEEHRLNLSKARMGHIGLLGEKNPMFNRRGEKHPNWKGGIHPLRIRIRRLPEYYEWRTSVFKRDGYSCQNCKQEKSGHLNVHHKRNFKNVLDDFLSKYNQFSPLEDRETLVRLAVSHEEFWDINNGVTLCETCHIETRKKWGEHVSSFA